jgi:DNA-binding CsgD family transcriptional regulator
MVQLSLQQVLDRLTDRELEVLLAAATGSTARETARRLGISHRTVESHLCAVYRKLDVHSALATVPILAETGLLGASPPIHVH